MLVEICHKFLNVSVNLRNVQIFELTNRQHNRRSLHKFSWFHVQNDSSIVGFKLLSRVNVIAKFGERLSSLRRASQKSLCLIFRLASRNSCALSNPIPISIQEKDSTGFYFWTILENNLETVVEKRESLF